MNRIIKFSVERSPLVFLLTALFIVGGIYSLNNLPLDAVPDITNVQVQINTSTAVLTPETIEQTITYPIESAMHRVPKVEAVRSLSRFGLSQVTVVFKDGSDIYQARQLIADMLQSVKLPEGIQPKLGPISTGLGELYHYTIEAKEPAVEVGARLEQIMELRAIQEWHVIPRLLTVNGVAEVNTMGGHPKRYYVQPSISKLSYYGLSFSDLVQAIQSNGYNTGAGSIEQTAEQLLVQGVGIFQSLDDIRQLPIKQLENFTTIKVSDVAQVELDKSIRSGAALVDGREAIIGVAFMLLGENSRSVAEAIDEKINQIRQTLPRWAKIETLYNRSYLVDGTIDTVQRNIMAGAVLVAVVLMLLIGNFRAALITVVTIPLSLVGTITLMNVFGISGNLMSLGALDFGVIIDGGVIVIDNCARRVSLQARTFGRDLTRDEIKDVIIQSTIEIRRAAGFGQLVIIAVFIPLLALGGVEGKMFRPMAIAFCFALGSAFILAFTVVPALAGSFLSGRHGRREPAIMMTIERGYTALLGQVLNRPRSCLGLSAALILMGVALLLTIGADFLPRLNEQSYIFQLVRPAGVSLQQAVEMQSLSDELIGGFDEVERVFSRIGTPEIATDPMPISLADSFVMLKPRSLWPTHEEGRYTYASLAEAIKQKLIETIPGQRVLITQPIEMRFNELLEGLRADISLKIYGDDIDRLTEIAEQAEVLIRKIPGAADVESESQGKSDILQIVPRMDAINALGISKSEVLKAVEVAIGGREVSVLYSGGMRFPVYVRLASEIREDIEILNQLPISFGQNSTAPLEDLADFEFVKAYPTISRENSKRRSALMINVRGRDTLGFVQQAQEQIDKHIELPAGYYVEWGGSFENLVSATQRLALLMPVTILLVVLMLYSALGNVRHTMLVLLGIPVAITGGLVNLYIWGLPLSVSAAIGFIALSGIAVLNGVVLISYLNDLKGQGLSTAVLEGSKLRLRAVLMTALTDILGFLPMMVAVGLGAEVQRPLATVVIGGIVTSTLLTLLVYPALYAQIEEKFSAH